MKNTISVLVLALSISFNIGYAQTSFEWAKNGGGNANDQGQAICTDTDGNIYVTGIAETNVMFGTNTLATGFGDIFIVKYDPTGNVLWAKMAGSTNNQEGGFGICTDKSGNCYITGTIRGTAYFDNDSITSNGGGDLFIAKYSASGNLIWVKNAGGTSDDKANSISIDSLNNIYITGKTLGVTYFDNDSLLDPNAGSADFLIAKYDSSGNFLMAKRAGGLYWDEGFGVDVDNQGNIYATGFFTDYINLDSTLTLFTNNPGRCPFVIKYDALGNILWAKAPNPNAYAQGTAISALNDGCIITGFFENGIQFGSNNLVGYGYEDIYIAKYDKDGNLIWVKNGGGIGQDIAYDITTDGSQNYYITGKFEDTAQFGGYSIISNGFIDAFVAKYDKDGNVKWAINAGGNSSNPVAYEESGNGITTDVNGHCFVTGTFKNTASFGSLSLSTNGNADVFTAKLSTTLGVSAIETEPLMFIYPNPNSGSFAIKNDDTERLDVSIKVLDINGQLIHHEKIKQIGQNEIKNVNLKEGLVGLYILQISDSKQESTHKLIIN